MDLHLDTLGDGIMGLTQEFGNFLLQACAVCLENQSHRSGAQMVLLNSRGNKSITLYWNAIVDDRVRRNWSDLQEATEYAATGVAIKLAQTESNSSCIERSSKGTGFDYWLGDENDLGIFERKQRLEISGILQETTSNTVASRMKSKEKQTEVSDGMAIDAHICVVEFSTPKGEYKIK